jgi:hypothetical protein
MSDAKSKLNHLAEIEGFDTPAALIEEYITDSLCPAICMTDGCDYSEELEPDQDRGWCPECNAGTLKSALVLAGLI